MPQTRPNPTSAESVASPYRNWSVAEQVDTDDTQATSPFKDLIQRDPVVCDTCFQCRYDVLSMEWWRGSFGWLDYCTWTARPDTSEPVPADGDAASSGMRLACSTCGTRAGVKHRPIPKSRMREYTGHISDTLASKRVAHDPQVLHAEVRERNTSAAQCRQDTDVFAPAVEAAIRASQGHSRRGYARGFDDGSE